MDAAELKDDDLHEKRMARLARERAELARLRAIETAARALKFSAYPAHGSGFVITVTGGNINDLESALNQQGTQEK